MDLLTMGRVSRSTSRSLLGRDLVRSQAFFEAVSFSGSHLCFFSLLSLNFPSSLVSSFWTLLFMRASNSAGSCLVDHVFCRRCRGDVFKSPSRRELSAFVGKPIETISVSLLSHSRHYFGIDEWRWLTSQFFKRRATTLST